MCGGVQGDVGGEGGCKEMWEGRGRGIKGRLERTVRRVSGQDGERGGEDIEGEERNRRRRREGEEEGEKVKKRERIGKWQGKGQRSEGGER